MAELEQPSLANSLRVPPLSILLSIRRGGSPNVFPTHWPRTTAKLLSWNCLPCTGNPCSSNLMKLRELCVIKVGRVCGMKAETPTRANSGNVKEDASFGNYYPNWTCIYIYQENQSIRSLNALLSISLFSNYSIQRNVLSIPRRKLEKKWGEEKVWWRDSPWIFRGRRWRRLDRRGRGGGLGICSSTRHTSKGWHPSIPRVLQRLTKILILLGCPLYCRWYACLALRKTPLRQKFAYVIEPGDVDLKRDNPVLRGISTSNFHVAYDISPSSSRQRKSLSLPPV